jgi:hypothetical protein
MDKNKKISLLLVKHLFYYYNLFILALDSYKLQFLS